jgi:hypothetical protein
MITLESSDSQFGRNVRTGEKERFAEVGKCGWTLTGRVRFAGEQNKRFRVGFVQVLGVDNVRFTYTRTIVAETHLRALPIRDGSKSEPPFYSKKMEESPKVDGRVVPFAVDVKLDDWPKNTVFWFHQDDQTNKLEHVGVHMEFDTWLAVQNITPAGWGDPAPADTLKLLKQWKIVVKYECGVDTSRPIGKRCKTGMNDSTLSEVKDPPEKPPACIWVVDQVANNSIGQEAILRSPAPLSPRAVSHARAVALANQGMAAMATPRTVSGLLGWE